MVSQHALQQGGSASGEGLLLGVGGCLLWGVCSLGMPAGGKPAPGGGGMETHKSRQLLLQTVRILLECILVFYVNAKQ